MSCHDGHMEPSGPRTGSTEPRPKRFLPRPERGIGWAEGGGLTTRQKIVPALALLVLVVALAYTLVPFTVADTVRCQAALRGSGLAQELPAGAIVGDPRKACRDVGNSRLSLAGVVGLAAVILGAAGLLLPPDPDEEAPDPAEEPTVEATEPPRPEDA